VAGVRDNPQASRYELETEGRLSVAEYQRQGNRLMITHVEVPDALRGRGIAAELMKAVVEDATRQQLEIVPVCSYAASYLRRQ